MEIVSSKYNVPWMKDGTKGVLNIHVEIDAPLELVWNILKNVNDWKDWNDGITGRITGEIRVGECAYRLM